MARTARHLTCNSSTQTLMPANVGRSYVRIGVKDTYFPGRAVAGVSLDGAVDAAEGVTGNLAVTKNNPIEIHGDVPVGAITIKGPAGLEIEAWEDTGGAERVDGWGFSVPVVPAVTAGAYSAGDIMGGLLEFDVVAPADDMPIILQDVRIALKSAVTPSLLLVLFNAGPSGTTKTDNAVYSLAAADAFKVIALPITAIGGYLTDHGTPNTIRLGNLAIPMLPAASTRKSMACWSTSLASRSRRRATCRSGSPARGPDMRAPQRLMLMGRRTGPRTYSFLNGALPPGAPLTRASTGWYFDSAGVLQSAANDAPRFTYGPSTLALQGLLNEPARTTVSEIAQW
ncbi:hypothetical protein [Reyranella sp.]|uniref:hypothetical protein n=1 Tax=Reyranella sp. TaxID=1929291 RepID=UPI004036FA7F